MQLLSTNLVLQVIEEPGAAVSCCVCSGTSSRVTVSCSSCHRTPSAPTHASNSHQVGLLPTTWQALQVAGQLSPYLKCTEYLLTHRVGRLAVATLQGCCGIRNTLHNGMLRGPLVEMVYAVVAGKQ